MSSNGKGWWQIYYQQVYQDKGNFKIIFNKKIYFYINRFLVTILLFLREAPLDVSHFFGEDGEGNSMPKLGIINNHSNKNVVKK